MEGRPGAAAGRDTPVLEDCRTLTTTEARSKVRAILKARESDGRRSGQHLKCDVKDGEQVAGVER